MQFKGREGEPLGVSDILGLSFTVGELLLRLGELNPKLPIVSGRNNEIGIALHHHAFVNPSNDYVSFTQLNCLGVPER
jgi:hypothetical protein